MDAIKKYWAESMEIQEVRWIIGLAGLAILICVGYYCVKIFRDMIFGGISQDPSAFLTDFQKMRDEGKLDDEEFSQLKKTIPNQVPDETQGSRKDPKP